MARMKHILVRYERSVKNVLDLGDQDVSFCYPLYAANGNIIKKELIGNNIFVPKLGIIVSKEYGANVW